jgi:hypothetical protein
VKSGNSNRRSGASQAEKLAEGRIIQAVELNLASRWAKELGTKESGKTRW